MFYCGIFENKQKYIFKKNGNSSCFALVAVVLNFHNFKNSPKLNLFSSFFLEDYCRFLTVDKIYRVEFCTFNRQLTVST